MLLDLSGLCRNHVESEGAMQERLNPNDVLRKCPFNAPVMGSISRIAPAEFLSTARLRHLGSA